MKTLKRKLKKLLYKLGQILINLGKPDLPFSDKVRATKEEYTQLAKEASRKRYKDIEKLEKQNGFSIDPEWIDGLSSSYSDRQEKIYIKLCSWKGSIFFIMRIYQRQ